MTTSRIPYYTFTFHADGTRQGIEPLPIIGLSRVIIIEIKPPSLNDAMAGYWIKPLLNPRNKQVIPCVVYGRYFNLHVDLYEARIGSVSGLELIGRVVDMVKDPDGGTGKKEIGLLVEDNWS